MVANKKAIVDDENISSNQREDDMAMVRQHVEKLMDHFDTVHIFASRHMPAELDGTAVANCGRGHWHARFGQISEWVIYEEERIRTAARKSDE